MGVDVDRTQPDDGCTDKDEHQNNDNCNQNPNKLATSSNLITLPVDILRCWDFSILNLQGSALVQVLFLDCINAATAGFPEAGV